MSCATPSPNGASAGRPAGSPGRPGVGVLRMASFLEERVCEAGDQAAWRREAEKVKTAKSPHLNGSSFSSVAFSVCSLHHLTQKSAPL